MKLHLPAIILTKLSWYALNCKLCFITVSVFQIFLFWALVNGGCKYDSLKVTYLIYESK